MSQSTSEWKQRLPTRVQILSLCVMVSLVDLYSLGYPQRAWVQMLPWLYTSASNHADCGRKWVLAQMTVCDTCMKDPNWIPSLTLAWLSPALSMHLSSESVHKNSLFFLLLLKYIKNKILSLNISSPKKKYKVKSQIWSMPGLQNRKQKAHS